MARLPSRKRVSPLTQRRPCQEQNPDSIWFNDSMRRWRSETEHLGSVSQHGSTRKHSQGMDIWPREHVQHSPLRPSFELPPLTYLSKTVLGSLFMFRVNLRKIMYIISIDRSLAMAKHFWQTQSKKKSVWRHCLVSWFGFTECHIKLTERSKRKNCSSQC